MKIVAACALAFIYACVASTATYAMTSPTDRIVQDDPAVTSAAVDYPVFGLDRIDTLNTNYAHQEIDTLDLQKKRSLLFSDIAKPGVDYRTVLAKLLHDYFKQEPRAALTPGELVGLLDLPVDALQSFSLDSGTLLLHLNPHQPMASTDRDWIAINKKLVAGILKDPYNRLDTGGRVPSPIHATYIINLQPQPSNSINPSAKMLALTFDDGPGKFTPQLLDALNKYEARATFFVVGIEVRKYPGIVHRAASDGHEIGNHSLSHLILPRLYQPQLEQQVDETQAIIRDATNGYTPRLMRPPTGAINSHVSEFLYARGLTPWLWNVDTKDWRDRDVQTVYDRIMNGAGDGKVILLHDIHLTSVAAALKAIPALKSEGYQLVTSSEILQYR